MNIPPAEFRQRRVAFLFPGEGGQRPGMGRDLYQAFGVFAAALDEACDRMAAHAPWPVRGLLLGEGECPVIPDGDYPLYTQDALFALQFALFRLFREWEVPADFLLGHSVGEIAAATAAGVFSLDDAAALMAERVRLVQELMPVGGAMVAVQVSADEAMESMAGQEERVSIAAINGPSSVVLSGDRPVVTQIARQWAERGRKVKELPVNRAFHSHHFDVLLPDFERFVARLPRSAPRIPLVSILSGRLAAAEEVCDPGYLPRQVRGTSRFCESMRWLEAAGVDVFIELSANGVLSAIGRGCLRPESAETALLIPALRGAGRSDEQSLLTAMAQLRDNGVHVSWRGPAPGPAPGPGPRPGPPPEGERNLLELVTAEVAAVLERPGLAGIEPDTSFGDLGFTSLAVVALADVLTSRVGIRVGAPLIFDHPSAGQLAAELARRLRPDPGAPPGPSPGARPQAAGPATAADSIVLVGMSCRFPGGVRSPEDLWRVLAEERDVISPGPANRSWQLGALYDPEPGRQGRSYVREGGFLPDAGEFDAGFFGISPVEALAMDPQQRLLLETSWEALEHAGIPPASVRGSRTGVFAGLMHGEYGARTGSEGTESEGTGSESTDAYLALGTATSIASGRVAYTLGLEGPVVTVDTACSSALVCLHLAAQALRRRECDLALAGAAMVMTGPLAFVEFSRQRALAPDARCKPFSAAANGTAWSEGVGMLVVERLSDARRHGHRVLAVLRGSAVNSDGASNGLTAPNGLAQQRVIRAALADAGLSPADVDAVEAHGTGTTLGDPIEAEALLATYGQARAADRPLLLGSVKSNLGHPQVAAGLAGVIKMVLAIEAGMVPATLHFDRPSPHVDWTSGHVEVVTRATPWPQTGAPRRAGISAFGISGTNAHLILEQPPAEAGTASPEAGTASPEAADTTLPWVLSGRSEAALRAQAGRLLAAMEASAADPADVGLSLGVSRTSFERRAVVVAADREGFLRGLARLAEGTPARDVVRGAVSRGSRKSAFMFSGQGAQRVGMGRALHRAYPVFRGVFDAVCAQFAQVGVPGLAEVTFGTSPAARRRLDQTSYTQPALFAIEVALFRLLESWGLRPDYLLGHSIGEIAAAKVSGVLTMADACALVAARGRLMGALPAGGAMVAVEATEAEVTARLRGWEDRIGIAAVNGPASVVISGDRGAVLKLARWFKGNGRRTTRLRVSHAFHSPRMAPMLDDFRDCLLGLSFAEPAIPVVSTVTGQLITAGELAAPEYWVRQVRQPVRFADAIRCLHDLAVTSFTEIGPSGALSAMVRGCLPEGEETSVVPVLRADRRDEESVLLALAELHVRGADIEWQALFPGARRVDLPTYAFQGRPYWLGAPARPAPARPGPAVDAWRYQVCWQPYDQSPNGTPEGTWLLVTPPSPAGGDHAAALIQGLTVSGSTVKRLEVTAAAAERGQLAARLRECAPVSGVICLPGGPAQALPRDGAQALPGWLALVQAMGDAGLAVPLWTLTQGAVAVDGADRPPDPDAAALWGAARVAALEHPARWGGLVDLPPRLDERAVERVLGVLAGMGAEDQVAIRDGGVLVRRLRPSGQEGAGARPDVTARWGAASVLVTGGTGALGRAAARWLADGGTGHVILAGRRGPGAPGTSLLAAGLARAGAAVTVVACDVADREAVTGLLAGVPADLPLRAVFHAAGAPQDTPLDDITAGEAAEVMRAKVAGARHLDELTAGLGLDTLVLFSSIAGVWGSGGQAAYAAASAFLDALAERRRAQGGCATSIAWGPWSGGGMGARGAAEQYLRARGVLTMPPDAAILALRRALERGDTCVTVADVDWPRFAATFSCARARPLLNDLAAPPGDSRPEDSRSEDSRPEDSRSEDNGPEDNTPSGDDAPGAELRRRLGAVAGPERDQLMLDLVRGYVAAVLGHQGAADIDADRTFAELGFGSLAAVELSSKLTTETGLRLPATVVFDQPSPALLARHLLAEVLGLTAATVSPEDPREQAAADDPIAIIAMSCRFPGGVGSPEDLWRLVSAGADAVSSFPDDRGWPLERLYDPDPDHSGTTYAREGCFLRDAAGFDAGFFGISPREALAMDPQQRLLLEVTWEALERAGIDPLSLHGSRTGVFVGTNAQDYVHVLLSAPDQVEGYIGTGSAASVLSGRIAYTLGLEGPAVSVDTACSSSLVALHQAIQALRAEDCSLALVGGVTVMSTPWLFVEFSRQRALAADGRCKAFAAAADGTGWGEGAGLLVIERLSAARRHGHRVLAVVRSSAVNQDGASNGLTAPNGLAQQRVIRAALAGAQLSAAEVDVVEAHGTGTVLGDAIEAQALLATYGQGRNAERPLWLGSVKSNIGHTQAAAGVAGIIKMVMAMRHGVLPGTLHIDRPSPQVDWSAGSIRLLTQARPWPRTGAPRRAGVTSFGISGTNVHTILEQPPEAPEAPEAPEGEDAVLPWVLSARSDAALREQASRLRSHLAQTPVRLNDVGYSLIRCRAALDRRAVIVAAGREALDAGLTLLADSADVTGGPGLVRGSPAGEPGQLALLFPGQGAQRAGMGSGLYRAYPVFAEAFDEVCEAFGRAGVNGLAGVISGDAEALDRTGYTQPALFAVEVALFRLLWSLGVRPGYLGGHSIGELAAAYVAGVLPLDDMCTLVAARATLMQKLPPGGAMAAVEAGEDEVRGRLAGLDDRVGIAALNGPRSTVISGDQDAVDELAGRFAAEGRKTRRLRVSHAFHSPRMEPMLAEFREVAARLSFSAPLIPVVSNVTGLPASAAELTSPDYWVSHVRSPVRFADGLRYLRQAGVTTFLEAGPGGVLTAMGQDAMGDDPAVLIPALRNGRPEDQTVVTALALLHVRGVPVDLAALFGGARPADLPTYAFQRKRYWLEPAGKAGPDTDTRFWDIVASGDADALATELGADADQLRVLLPSLSAWRRRRGPEQATEQATDSWAYRPGWRLTGDAATLPRLGGTWLLAEPDEQPDQQLAAGLAEALGAHGAAVMRLPVRTGEEGRAELAARIPVPPGGFAGVLSLLAADERAHPEYAPLTRGLTATVSLAQALGDVGADAPLWAITRGAVSAGAADEPVRPAQTQIWGLGRTLAIEHPDRWGGVIDLPPRFDEPTAGRVLQILALGDGEDQLAVRPAGVYGRRLARVAADAPRPGVTRAWAEGTVLISGGTGALGAAVARWLAGQGAGHLLLASRRGAEAPGAAELGAELTRLGTRVSMVACDVAERAEVGRLLGTISPRWPLRAVFHTAGVLDDGVFSALTAERFSRVFRAKALGAQHLDELTRELDLDAFVVFSSVTATMGNAGQANYAAANAFLDGLAERRRSAGLAATSIAWGPWAEAGMAATETTGRRLRRGGISPIAPESAVVALERALGRGDTCVTIADIDWDRLRAAYTAVRRSRLFDSLPEARRGDRDGAAATGEVSSADELRKLPVADRDRALLDLVRGQAAVVLGHGSAREVEPARPFRELGFDSLTSVELRNLLGAATGLRMRATMVFDHPTPVALAAHLKAELFTDPGGPAELPEPEEIDAATLEEMLDIVEQELRQA